MRTTLNPKGLAAMLADASETVVREVTPEVSADAKRIVPVRTGGTMDAIGFFYEGEGTEVIGIVGVDEEHVDPEGVVVGQRGFWLEYGTENMAAQPFLGPALYQNRAIR